jgi:zinc protease
VKRHVELARDTPLAWLSILFPGGAACDPAGLEGLAHHAGELARRGAGGRSRAELDAALDQIGATVEAGSTRDSLGVSGMCLARHLPAVFDAASDVLCAPAMAVAEHEKLIRETRGELDEIRDDDASLASRFFALHCAPGHAYARALAGTEASLDRLTVETARGEIERTVSLDSAVLGLAGDIDAQVADELTAKLAARLPHAAPRALAEVTSPPAARGRRLVVVDKPRRTQSQILFGHVGPRYGSDDAIDLLPVETAFGGMFTSRLMQAIRVERGWSYGAGCKLVHSRGPHWFQVHLAPSADVTPDALARALAMYEELCDDGIRADELEFTKGFLRGGHAFSRATARQRLRDSLRAELFGLPERFHQELPDRIEAVTLAASRRAIDRCLSARDLCVVIVTSADGMLGRLDKLGFDDVEVVAHDSY